METESGVNTIWWYFMELNMLTLLAGNNTNIEEKAIDDYASIKIFHSITTLTKSNIFPAPMLSSIT